MMDVISLAVTQKHLIMPDTPNSFRLREVSVVNIGEQQNILVSVNDMPVNSTAPLTYESMAIIGLGARTKIVTMRFVDPLSVPSNDWRPTWLLVDPSQEQLDVQLVGVAGISEEDENVPGRVHMFGSRWI